jgi:hypothetical protein
LLLINKKKNYLLFPFFKNKYFTFFFYWYFLHSWLITGFATRVTRWVPHVEQELITLPENLSSPHRRMCHILLRLLSNVAWCNMHMLNFQLANPKKIISSFHSLKTNILHFSFIDCSWVVIESSFDPGEWLQAPGSLWFFYLFIGNVIFHFIYLQKHTFFGLTRPGLKPTIYRTRGKHANHYATNAVHVN